MENKNQGDLKYIMIEDALAAGLKPVNDRLNTGGSSNNDGNSSGSNYSGYQSGPMDIRDNRVTLFTHGLKKDEKAIYHYTARALQRGTFTAPAARAEPMYDPAVYGQSIMQEITVK